VNEFEHRHEEWKDAVNARDIEAYAELVAEDVVWIPPRGEAIVGRQAFRAWLRPFFSAYRYDYSTSNHRFLAAGDWIAESADFDSSMTPVSGGSPMSHRGSYLAIWKRASDGAWRIDRYVDQSGLRGEAPESS
jgi:uncharacterized protein (TIGR02246 family)